MSTIKHISGYCTYYSNSFQFQRKFQHLLILFHSVKQQKNFHNVCVVWEKWNSQTFLDISTYFKDILKTYIHCLQCLVNMNHKMGVNWILHLLSVKKIFNHANIKKKEDLRNVFLKAEAMDVRGYISEDCITPKIDDNTLLHGLQWWLQSSLWAEDVVIACQFCQR